MNHKKILSLSSLSIISIGLVTTGIMGYASNEVFNDDITSVKPMNRGKNYEHFSLRNYFNNDEFKKKITKIIIKNEKYNFVFCEKKFISEIQSFIKKSFKNIERFKSKSDLYEFVINYKYSENNILFDLLWNLPNSKYYFYDQIKLSII